MVVASEKTRTEYSDKAQAFCDRRSCAKFDVKKYVDQLRRLLPNVPPIDQSALCSLHKSKDYKGMVQLIKKSMSIEGVTIQIMWVP